METFDFVLPAGGKLDPATAAVAGTDVKALIEFDGETILARTIQAVRDSGRCRRIAVIGGAEVQAAVGDTVDFVLPEGGSGPDNIWRGLDALQLFEGRVGIVTTDLPFLTAWTLDRFYAVCPKDADVCIPLVRQSEYETAFPGSTATFVALADDAWTTGCAYRMDVAALRRIRPQIDRVFANRKSKLGMARLLGPAFVLKWLTKRLTMVDVVRKIETLLDCKGAPIQGAPPELAFDIDAADDLEYARRRPRP